MSQPQIRSAEDWPNAVKIGSYTSWMRYLYYSVDVEQHLWDDGSIQPTINFSHCRKLILYAEGSPSELVSSDLNRSLRNLDNWLNDHKDATSVPKSSVLSYYSILRLIYESLKANVGARTAVLIARSETKLEGLGESGKLSRLRGDLIEADNALRLGLGTATVFHVSRMLEQVVRILAQHLRVPLKAQTLTWNYVTD